MPKETFFNLPENKRLRILNVLLEEFSNQRYQDVSIDRIVSGAQISKGSFYQYFEDKKDCYFYLLEMAIDEKFKFMSSFQPPAKDTDPFEVLRSLIEAGLSFQFSNPRLGRIGYLATMDDVPLPEETRALINQSGSGYFSSLLQAGIEQGTIDPDLDPEIGAFIFNTIFTNLGEFILEHHQLDASELMAEGPGLFNRPDIIRFIHKTLDILEKGFRNRTVENS